MKGIGSAAVGVLFNAVHPRVTSESLNDTGAASVVVAAAESWRIVHYVSVTASLVGVAAVVPILVDGLDGSSRWSIIATVRLAITTRSSCFRWARWARHQDGSRSGGRTPRGDRDTLMGSALRSVDVSVLEVIMIGYFGVIATVIGSRRGRAVSSESGSVCDDCGRSAGRAMWSVAGAVRQAHHALVPRVLDGVAGDVHDLAGARIDRAVAQRRQGGQNMSPLTHYVLRVCGR